VNSLCLWDTFRAGTLQCGRVSSTFGVCLSFKKKEGNGWVGIEHLDVLHTSRRLNVRRGHAEERANDREGRRYGVR